MAASTYQVQRETHISAPPATVRERIVDLRRWQAWSPWEGLDPNLQRTYGGPETGTGAWYEWRGRGRAGAGRMEITGDDDRAVEIDLQFVKPFRSRSSIRFTLTPEDGGTRVAWIMTGRKTLATRLVGLFRSMDAMVGPDFEQGLSNLKDDAEADGGAG